MDIYLDNSATTRPYDSVVAKVGEVMSFVYGNPSSMHRMGIAAEKVMKEAKEKVAATLGASPNEIFFTSGGTESNNLAIRGICGANRGKHIISTAIEHPATLKTLSYLESQGYEVDLVSVDKDGIVNFGEFVSMIRPDTVLASCMYVNNEIGSVQPVGEMRRALKRIAPRAYFHIDAVQAYCKIPFTAGSTGADLISLSGHKIHGPKGVGVLYVRGGTKISPILFGGGQQSGLRSGTENPAGCAGFATAAERGAAGISVNMSKVRTLRDLLRRKIEENVSDISVNTPENSAPHILNISFGGVKSEVMLHTLERDGIYVSSGSACSSHKREPSYVLTSIGLSPRMIDGSIRFSLSEFNTPDDIEKTASAVCRAAASIRRVMKYK